MVNKVIINYLPIKTVTARDNKHMYTYFSIITVNL